jgi:hypothetical protein
MSTHKTTIEIEVEIQFEYDPGEPTVYYYKDGSGHPGTAPSVEITSVISDGVEIIAAIPNDTLANLETDIFENYEVE